eukprot:COSAG02_NODE_40130_length_409_cov_0.580645_1_plen_46_part_10
MRRATLRAFQRPEEEPGSRADAETQTVEQRSLGIAVAAVKLPTNVG